MSNAEFTVVGMDKLEARLRGLKGRELQRKANRIILPALRATVVPAIKANTPHGRRSPWNRHPDWKRRGPMWKKVTARGVRLRGNEIAAATVGPRTFYAGWVIRGTKAHLIRARHADTGQAVTVPTIRRINRASGAEALVIGGMFASQVMHPGAKPNPFVTDAMRRRGDDLARMIGSELLRER